MSMKIITGSTGTTHVTSNNDGEFNEALYGKSLIVLPNGNKLSASIVDNNTITIGDGDLVFQGRHALIEPNTTETITIETGTVGMNRIDLIVAHYELDSSTGYETLTLEVIKGTESASTAVAPSITEGDIRTGDKIAEAILYQVNISGISLSSVTFRATLIENVVPTLISALEAIDHNETDISQLDADCVKKGITVSGTLAVDESSITLTSSEIKGDSIIDVYVMGSAGSTIPNLAYESIIVSEGSVKINFEESTATARTIGVRVS